MSTDTANLRENRRIRLRVKARTRAPSGNRQEEKTKLSQKANTRDKEKLQVNVINLIHCPCLAY